MTATNEKTRETNFLSIPFAPLNRNTGVNRLSKKMANSHFGNMYASVNKPHANTLPKKNNVNMILFMLNDVSQNLIKLFVFIFLQWDYYLFLFVVIFKMLIIHL